MLHYNEKKERTAKNECVQTLKGLQQLVASRNLIVQVNQTNPDCHRIRVVDSKENVYCEGTMTLTASRKSYKDADVKSAQRMLKSLNSSIIGNVIDKVGEIFTGGNDNAENTNASAEPEVPEEVDESVDLDAEYTGSSEVPSEVVDEIYQLARTYMCDITSCDEDTVDGIPVTVLVVEPDEGDGDAWDDYSRRSRRDTEDDWAEPPAYATETDIQYFKDAVQKLANESGLDVEFDYSKGNAFYITLLKALD